MSLWKFIAAVIRNEYSHYFCHLATEETKRLSNPPKIA